MTPEQRPITGAEYRGSAATPTEALAQFYAAFNAASLDGLATSWEQSEDIAMDNPVGGIVRGWVALRQVYAKLVQGPARITVEFYDYTLHEVGDLFYAVGSAARCESARGSSPWRFAPHTCFGDAPANGVKFTIMARWITRQCSRNTKA